MIHARAFRRLEAKTQVFPPGLSDHFRNRLTHTIEVAQIARTVAGVLAWTRISPKLWRSATISAIRRLPTPARRSWIARCAASATRFDHNLHALRIVESFEQRYARFPGLNLTFEVREGIAKHSRDFAPGEIPGAGRISARPAPAARSAAHRPGR